ncbi:hypothetical protein [Desulfoplanes formicivorans]|uniref:Lipoprotein n=1 Tax=Desulfoplanes formicivorans TaxID=1592317 RepID=A0A194AG17_9BACT|nr:hypothetical protein [Desulfoplanes formicivorans]GAU07714.1 hypothetical protein DPF_0411 [Desulfoplanes formicivorans]
MKVVGHLTIALLVLGCMTMASSCFAFFPEPGELAASLEKETHPLSSFQAILSFPKYPDVSCNLWVKGNLWRQEFVETVQGRPRLVGAALGTRDSVTRVFPPNGRIPLPGLVVWQFSFRRWLDMGIDPAIMSYQFLIDRPCLVVGAEDGQMHASQLWMDKERHVPVRAMWHKEGVRYDLIWDAWSRLGNFWLPHTMWRAVDGQHPLEMHIRWNGVNINLNDGLFSASAMDRQFRGTALYPTSSPLFSLWQGTFPGHQAAD